MKKILILSGTGIFSVLSLPLLAYGGGRNGMTLSIGLIPLAFIAAALGCACLLALSVLLILSLFRQREAILPIVIGLGLMLSLFFVQKMCIKQNPYKLGLKQRVLSITTPEDLRQIAKAARENIPLSAKNLGRLPGPGKTSLWDEKIHATAWTKISQKTRIGALGDAMMISVNNDSVSLSWGGVLVGHWGITISDKRGKTHQQSSPYSYIAPDIHIWTSAS